MNALGWVATMLDGSQLPFALKPAPMWADWTERALEDISQAGVSHVTPGLVRAPVFEIRGTVRRPLMRGGYVTKLVLREASET